jgi:hypothetical protein
MCHRFRAEKLKPNSETNCIDNVDTNLFSIISSLLLQDILSNAPANSPVKHHQGGIHASGDIQPRFDDQESQILEQVVGYLNGVYGIPPGDNALIRTPSDQSISGD